MTTAIEKKGVSLSDERQGIEQRLFTVEAAAEYLRALGATTVTVCFIRAMINTGAIPHLKIGKRFYVSRDSLDLWVENRQTRRK